DVTGKQQHGKAVDGGGGGAGDHVRGAGTYGGDAGECALAVPGLGERRRYVHGSLLVFALVVTEIGVLLERLPESRNAAVAEDSPGALKKLVFEPVALDVLLLQESDQRLRHGHISR